MRWKKYGWIFAGVCLCILGALFGRTSAKAATISKGDLKKKIVAAYQNYQTALDVKQYGIYNNAAGSRLVSDVMEEVINETPYLFYTGRSFSKEILENTNLIIKIDLSYSSDYLKNGVVNISKIKNTRKKLDVAIKTIISGINKKMSDVEKALLLHDYLVQNVSYDDSKNRASRLTEVGALLQHKANCQGYSMAYRLLLEQVGITCKCISSSQMSHMWNLVKIGKKWYHVDVTWDDPLNSRNKTDQYGVVYHDNFLVSTAAIQKTGHYGVPASKATNTKYDKKYWRRVKCAFWYQSGEFIYGTSMGIYSRSGLTGSHAKCLKKIAAKCLVRRSAKQYYLISGNKIFLFKTNNRELKKVYEASYGCTLTQLKYSGKTLTFRYLKGNKLYKGMKKVS